MIHDLASEVPSSVPEYDICVIGSGPAGTTIANELADGSLRACVLESGRQGRTEYSDALKMVESEGIHIKSTSRDRILGGSSTRWGGRSGTLDPIDFENRPFMERSGWPFGRRLLLPFMNQAIERYGFPPLASFGSAGFGMIKRENSIPPLHTLEEKIFLASTTPVDFGLEYQTFYQGENVDLYLDATCLRLEASPGTRRIAAARVRTSAGAVLLIRARMFVLACGGIENPRILLNSRDLCPAGLGNERDQVGRCLMNHPKNKHGVVHLARPVVHLRHFFGAKWRAYFGYAGLRLTESEQHRREVLNSYVRLEPHMLWSGKEGAESFKQRANSYITFLNGKAPTNGIRIARTAVRDWYRRWPRIHKLYLANHMEMEPHPENRVMLSTRTDTYGQPIPLVRHDCTELDKRSLLELHRALREEFERIGFGTLESSLSTDGPWPGVQDAGHHMGTTRMGSDPKISVCDPNAKLHGVDNVYLAGTSLFPTGGCANPTFTIVALAIRLAEHLRLGERLTAAA